MNSPEIPDSSLMLLLFIVAIADYLKQNTSEDFRRRLYDGVVGIYNDEQTLLDLSQKIRESDKETVEAFRARLFD